MTLSEYEIQIATAYSEDAETKENAWIVLEGKKGRSKEFVMENPKKKKFLRYVERRLYIVKQKDIQAKKIAECKNSEVTISASHGTIILCCVACGAYLLRYFKRQMKTWKKVP